MSARRPPPAPPSRAARLAFALASSLTVAVALLLPRPAAAHPLDLGYLRLDAEQASLAAGLDLDLAAASHLLATSEAELSAAGGAGLQRRAAALADLTLRLRLPSSDVGACRWMGEPFASLAHRTVSVTLRLECPAGAKELRWALPFVARPPIAATFQLLVKAHTAAGSRLTTLDRNTPELTLALDGAEHASWGFAELVWWGVEHIGATPDQWHDADGWKLPDGLDHILFLLALLLAGGTIVQLVGITTGFTLGHSITLALSALGLVRPPPEVIEPLIALSIALVAAEAFLLRPGNHRWKLAAAFGLVHGFGFAGALNELGLSAEGTVVALFGYNLGVELGQLAIVLVLAPMILLLARRPSAHRLVVRAIAAAIFVAGLYWFAQRIIASM